MKSNERFYVELGKTTSPIEIIDLLKDHTSFDIGYLEGKDVCFSFSRGKKLGEGKLGTIYDIGETENDRELVLKEFHVNDSVVFKNDTYILSSALNEIVMSAYISYLRSNSKSFCACLPYFHGFFICYPTGYIVMEKLGKTFSSFMKSSNSTSKVFRGLMFQVLYSLLFLLDNKVMHNDLHSKNVMLQDTSKISYKNVSLDTVNMFAFKRRNITYYIPNLGYLAVLADYDFSAKFSSPKVVPRKVYNELNSAPWNLKFRFAKSYDIITFVSYVAYYLFIREEDTVEKELTEMRMITLNITEFIVDRVEKQYTIESDSEDYKELDRYPIISKLLDLVSIPQFRPYSMYDNIDLGDILNVSAFKQFLYNKGGSFLLARI